MPTAPKGQQRPADANASAREVMRFATGEERPDGGKDKAAQYLGQRGGKARALALSKKRRTEIARAAAAKRWAK